MAITPYPVVKFSQDPFSMFRRIRQMLGEGNADLIREGGAQAQARLGQQQVNTGMTHTSRAAVDAGQIDRQTGMNLAAENTRLNSQALGAALPWAGYGRQTEDADIEAQAAADAARIVGGGAPGGGNSNLSALFKLAAAQGGMTTPNAPQAAVMPRQAAAAPNRYNAQQSKLSKFFGGTAPIVPQEAPEGPEAATVGAPIVPEEAPPDWWKRMQARR